MVYDKRRVPDSLTEDLRQACQWPRLGAIFAASLYSEAVMNERFGHMQLARTGWDTMLTDRHNSYNWSRTLGLASITSLLKFRARALRYGREESQPSGTVLRTFGALRYHPDRSFTSIVDTPDLIQDLTALQNGAGQVSLVANHPGSYYDPPYEVVRLDMLQGATIQDALKFIARATNELLVADTATTHPI